MKSTQQNSGFPLAWFISSFIGLRSLWVGNKLSEQSGRGEYFIAMGSFIFFMTVFFSCWHFNYIWNSIAVSTFKYQANWEGLLLVVSYLVLKGKKYYYLKKHFKMGQNGLH